MPGSDGPSELLARAAHVLPQWCPHVPHPKQLAFLMLDCEEAFFGGAARGGKSDSLLMAALQYVDQPNYAALILRRTYADLALPDAIMDRAAKWLRETPAKWLDKTKTWEFPSGATLSFGYLDTENDKYRYQGSSFSFIGFDELTHFTESQYTYLFSRVSRREGSAIPGRMRSASNPGGLGHEWVRGRFIASQEEGRIFIPARLADNPSEDQEAYLSKLNRLDPITRAQLRDGDWSIRADGSVFRRERFVVVSAPPPGLLSCVRAWDLAASESDSAKRTAGVKIGRLTDGRVIVLDVVCGRWSPGARDAVIEATARADGYHVGVVIEQEPGSGGIAQVDSLKRRLSDYKVRGVRPTGEKLVRAGPVSAAAEQGQVLVVAGEWTGRFFDELEAVPNGLYWDQVDAFSLAYGEIGTARGLSPEDVLAGSRRGRTVQDQLSAFGIRSPRPSFR